jgi:cell wall-associated NlpC family hydrolase
VVLFRLHRSEAPRHCGIMMTDSRFVHAQERIGVVEADLSDAWRRHLPAKHAGLLSGDDHFIHAQDGAAVCEAALTSWWRRRIAYVFRFPIET